MTGNAADIAARIRLGEDSTLELKAVRVEGKRIEPRRESLADELTAFANTRGGTLVLGIDDRTRAILGIDAADLDAVERHVIEAALSLIDPPLPIVTRKLELSAPDGAARPVLVVEVPRSLHVHKGPGGYLHRVGSSKRGMTTEYLARLFQQRSQTRLIRFDEHAVAGATAADLDPALWQRFRTERSREADHDLLVKLGCSAAMRIGSGALPSRAC